MRMQILILGCKGLNASSLLKAPSWTPKILIDALGVYYVTYST